jgi:excisionase family DNA binding protein
MSDYLTSRQVQNILQVDRITVYRMLQDGRLKGVKIGQQWRFPQSEVDRLIHVRQGAPEPAAALPPDPNFPTHCVQTIQDLFAEVGQASAMVVDVQGRLLTEVSRPARYCQMLLGTPSGQQVAQAAWRDFVAESARGSRYFSCPFGLQYIGAPIFDRAAQVGLFLTGPFYWQPPNPREEAERIRRLAAAHGLDAGELAAAAREIQVIDPALHERVENWPVAAARAVMSILNERSGFMNRLQQIASLTHIA